MRLAIGRVEQLDQRSEVAAVAADPEHRSAGKAVQRLDDDVAMLFQELPRRAERACQHRRRHELREVEHPQLFRRIADRRRVVDDQGLVLDPLEQVRRRDVAEIEWRVLAHQDDVDVAAQVEDREVTAACNGCRPRPDADGVRAGVEASAFEGQGISAIMVKFVAALLR